LSHGTFSGIYNEGNAIDHVHDSLYFSPKVGMAWGIDYVDDVALVADAGAFGKNGDPSFSLKLVGIHHSDLGNFGGGISAVGCT
jgi:hypothetical protein